MCAIQKIAWLDQKMHTAQSKMANFSNWILLILNTGLARKDINRDREWFFLAIFGVRNRKYYVYYIRNVKGKRWFLCMHHQWPSFQSPFYDQTHYEWLEKNFDPVVYDSLRDIFQSVHGKSLITQLFPSCTNKSVIFIGLSNIFLYSTYECWFTEPPKTWTMVVVYRGWTITRRGSLSWRNFCCTNAKGLLFQSSVAS